MITREDLIRLMTLMDPSGRRRYNIGECVKEATGFVDQVYKLVPGEPTPERVGEGEDSYTYGYKSVGFSVPITPAGAKFVQEVTDGRAPFRMDLTTTEPLPTTAGAIQRAQAVAARVAQEKKKKK